MSHLGDPVPPFSSRFDAALADVGPPAVFLRDIEGMFRFDAEWTRDAWGRTASVGPGAGDPGAKPARCWALARDTDSGYVQIVLATAPDLLRDHPRMAFRTFPSLEEATEALARLGRPPLAAEAW